jgi:hypothetical protein
VDLSKLSLGDKLIAGSAIGLFIFSFLPWFTVSVEGGAVFGDFSRDFSGWDVGFLWGRLPVFLAVLMAAYVGVKAFAPDTKLPSLPVAYGQALLGVGVLAAFLVILKLLIGEDAGVPGGLDGTGIEISRAYGLFLSVLATVGLAVGGFFKMQEGEDDSGGGGGDAPPTTF